MPRFPRVVAASGVLHKFGVVATYLGAGDQPPAWVRACEPAPFARQLEQLTSVLGHAEYDPEHRCLSIRRSETTRLSPSQLYEIEIYLPPGKQPRLYRGYVHEITATGATFRSRCLAPLTQDGLRRAIRDVKRKPVAATDDALTVIEQAGRKWLDRRDGGRVAASRKTDQEQK